MDRKFDTDNFERLLREKSDEFRMYPSKRVWHSIYNNLHPGRKWPSVAMCITLIASLLLVGYLNTDSSRQDSYNASKLLAMESIPSVAPKSASVILITATTNSNSNTQKNQPLNQQEISGNNNLHVNAEKNITADKVATRIAKAITSNTNPSAMSSNRKIARNRATISSGISTTIVEANATSVNTDKDWVATTENTTAKNINSINKDNTTSASFAIASGKNKNEIEVIKEVVQGMQEQTEIVNTTALQNNNNPQTENLEAGEVKILALNSGILAEEVTITADKKLVTDKPAVDNATEKNTVATAQNSLSPAQKEWIENYALYNRPAPKKWAGKLEGLLYATPSVVYRKLSVNSPDKILTNGNSPFLTSGSDINQEVEQRPSLGLEIGAGLKYDLLKRVKINIGLQFNYTRYNTHAFSNSHPVSTSITLIDSRTNLPYEVYRSTPYSNKYGLTSTKLHNETFQLSIPIGADIKLAGNDNIQWYAGASIQPELVLSSKSYLISSDRLSYIKDGSFLNRFNMNAGFETFVTYKTDNGFTWQVGPQFRTQLFSTNSKSYSISEKLVSYGLKIGMIKNL